MGGWIQIGVCVCVFMDIWVGEKMGGWIDWQVLNGLVDG